MPYIECRDLYKNYPGQKALDGASMTLEKGEFVALQGISGSGKSTLLALIGLLDLPSSGDIFIDGQPTAGAGFTARCHLRNQHFGFVFQQFHLIGDFTVLENVQLPLRYSGLSRRHWRARAMEILDKVGLANRHHNLPGELSGGEQQRVAIARALVSRPGLLLADEPTGNLDSKTGEHIMALFQTLHQEGMGLLMATHNPAYAGRAQRCLHLQDGRFSDTPG
ncbi:MAG TPA: ABC transporter ATP-binding protein [Chromatiaceae bacterium]|nr:ABC transporter ATP-binding protein [Chromatiaceae bacterium]